MHRGIQHPSAHFGYTDMWIGLRDLLHQPRQALFVTVYWARSMACRTCTDRYRKSITEIRRSSATCAKSCSARNPATGARCSCGRDHGHTPFPIT